MTTGKLNCPTRCSLDSARRTALRGLLGDCRPVKEDSPASEVRIRIRDSPVQKTGTADRQNTAGEGITKKNPGAGIQDRDDKVSSLCGVINNCSSARWKSK
jgi:hypothetical protein